MWTVFTCTIHAEHTRNEFYRTLSILGTNFIACWAYSEPISSHAEHARKCRISRPNRIRFSKISCYRPLGPYGFGFCKKSHKKISCLCTFNMHYVNALELWITFTHILSTKKLSAIKTGFFLPNFFLWWEPFPNYTLNPLERLLKNIQELWHFFS